MNLILEDCAQVPYFTNMRVVFDALELNASDFDWFVSDIEHAGGDAFCSEDHWISGEDLERALLSNDIQFVWAVFSAIPKGGPRPAIHEPPYADGNPAFWSDPSPRPQLIGALFEIVCWDSSATILVGLPDAALRRFWHRFPDSKPLNAAPR
ncbi:MAG: hypothetical protein ACK41V_19800 [Acidovorax sp.]|uniref:hypothetical protein n=1 Tax=Acidovorax sp. TaxID=1872122 RepID=UPI003918B92F